MKQLIFFIIIFALASNSYFSFAQTAGKEISFTLDDRDRIIRVEEKLESLRNEMNGKAESLRSEMNGKIESLRSEMNGKIESLRNEMNTRFEQIDKRFDSMFTFLWILTGIFTAIMVTAITLAFWDRKTIVEVSTQKAVEKIEKESKLIQALRELAKEDKKIASVLKQFGLL